MNKQAVWAIARKDMRAIAANVQVWLPMLILPVVLGVLLPAGLVIALQAGDLASSESTRDLLAWLDRIPVTGLGSDLPSLQHRVVYLVSNYMLAPFFLLIPLMAGSVVSADSFAGEKERGTLESLLFSPADLLSLFTGKVLAAFLPAIGLSFGAFLLSAISMNAAGWPLFGRLFFPTINWLPLLLLVIPMISLVAILLSIFISARVATFQAAYQMGGLIVLPVIGLLVGQLSGALLLDLLTLTLIGLGLVILNGLLLRLIIGRLDRGRLFESQIR